METKKVKELRRSLIVSGDFVKNPLRLIDTTDIISIEWHVSCMLLQAKEFNRPFFLVYDGALRQFKIKKQHIFPFSTRPKGIAIDGTTTRISSLIVIDIAGLGEITVLGSSLVYTLGKLPFDVFESVEDYRNGLTYDFCYMTVSSENIVEVYAKQICFESFLSSYRAVGYKWDGTKTVMEYLTTDISLGFSWDGVKFISGMEGVKRPYYLSKEECENDNSIKVEYFATLDENEGKDDERTEGEFLGLGFSLTDDEIEIVKHLISSFDK